MWYYACAGKYEGPFQEDYIGRKLRAGVLQRETLVWREGMAEWQPLAQTELAELLETSVPWQSARPSPQEEGRSSSLEAYQQRGYEEPQLHRPLDSTGRESCQRTRPTSESSKNGTQVWQDLSGLTRTLTVLLSLLMLESFWRLARAFRAAVDSDFDSFSAILVQPISDWGAWISILTWVVFLVWLYRSMGNLPSLGVNSIRLVPGFVILSFYLPLLHWFVPYFAMRKLWRASFAPKQWTSQSVGIVVTLLWFCWLMGGQRGRFSEIAANYSGPFLSGQVSDFSIWLVPEALNLLTFLTAIMFVTSIWRAQLSAHSSPD